MNDQTLKVKIDTKEKMHVITICEPLLAANMTESFRQLLLPFLNRDVKNVIINFEEVTSMERPFAEEMISLQRLYYEKNASMVFCNLGKNILKDLDAYNLLEGANVTPTESEAWDIVQMEEIEREYL